MVSPSLPLVHVIFSPPSAEGGYSFLKVGCVAPHSDRQHDTTLEDYLHETRVVAGRGAKIISWPEAAVRLEKGANPADGARDGWDGFGAQEKDLLRRVGQVADSSGAHILATYLVPSAGASYDLHNIATLVGPSLDKSQPNIVFSSTKHLPVPFVEGFPLIPRESKGLASSSTSLPLARVEITHSKKTHHAPETLAEVDVSAALCLDISSPSLLTQYRAPAHTNTQPSRYTPQLLLNPSSIPDTSTSFLAISQLAQLTARATEINAFILRCDTPGGISALVGPNSEHRHMQPGNEGWSSWEATIDLRRGGGGTVWSWWGARWWLGGEWGVLLMIGMVLVAGEALAPLKQLGEGWKISAVEWWSRSRFGITERRGETRLIDADD